MDDGCFGCFIDNLALVNQLKFIGLLVFQNYNSILFVVFGLHNSNSFNLTSSFNFNCIYLSLSKRRADFVKVIKDLSSLSTGGYGGFFNNFSLRFFWDLNIL